MAVIFAHFLIGSLKRFYSGISFYCFVTSSLFRILVVWWVRWIQQRKIWWTWIWIRVSWYVWWRIWWFVVWHRITFRCHSFFWWVIWWWWRVTFSIGKYSWSGYRMVQIEWMYQRGCINWIYLYYVCQWCSLINCTSWCVHRIPIPWHYFM